jgi:hypothetical protein
MVTDEVFEPIGTFRNNLRTLDNMFPKPEPRTASVEFLQKLGCPEDLIPLAQQLNDPWKVQEYTNSNLKYDHSVDTRGFVGVARTGLAHCFEGAMFCYTALWVNGWEPRVVLLQADNKYGEDHNIVVYRHNNHLGAIAMSSWQTLKDRPPVFTSLRDLIGFGYWFAYTSELVPKYTGVYNLVGYTDPINLVEKFKDTKWMFREGTSAEDSIFRQYVKGEKCTNLFTGKRYFYQDDDLELGEPVEKEAR